MTTRSAISITSKSCSTSPEDMDESIMANGQELSASVRDLLDDDMFNEDKRRSIQDMFSENTYELESKYQTCLSLFVKGELKHCLELMYTEGLLEESVLKKSDIKFFDLYLNVSNELLDFKTLGLSLHKIAINIFDGNYESLLNDKYFQQSLLTEVEFMNRYFNCCIKTIKLTGDIEKRIYIQDQLKSAINQSTVKIKKFENSEGSQFNYLGLNLFGLVQKYLVDVEVGYLKTQVSSKLYWDFVDRIPNLQEVLSKSNLNKISFQEQILHQLGSLKIKQESKPKLEKYKDEKRADTKQDNAIVGINDSKSNRTISTIDSQDDESKAVFWQTILDNQFLKNITSKISENNTIKFLYQYMDTMYIPRQSIILLCVFTLYLLRKKLSRVRYLLGNIPKILQHLLPYMLEILRTLSSV